VKALHQTAFSLKDGTDGIGPFIAIFLFTGLLYAVSRRLSTDFSA
jgi:hypothetical protein